MKKGMIILFASFMVLLSGCIRIEIEPEKSEPAPVVQIEPAMAVECKTCIEKENKNCAQEVNTVVYKSSCNETCGFPVSVRVPSNCKGSMQ